MHIHPLPPNNDTVGVLKTKNKNQADSNWPLQYYLTHSKQQQKKCVGLTKWENGTNDLAS